MMDPEKKYALIGELFGLVSLIALSLFIVLNARGALAAVPNKVSNDTAIFQEITEIHVKKARPRIQVQKLAKLEKRYQKQELAKHPRLQKVIQRVLKSPYQYSGRSVGKKRARAKGR